MELSELHRDMLSADPVKLLTAEKVAEQICGLGNITSAYDLACGSGVYTKALADQGIDVVGMDLDGELPLKYLRVPAPFRLVRDLSGDIADFWACRDIVVSIETAEHIAEKNVGVFFNNIVTLARSWIFLTASPAEGKYHLNPRPRAYWIDQVERLGKHEYQHETSVKMMEYFKTIMNSGLIWFKRDLMIFKEVK